MSRALAVLAVVAALAGCIQVQVPAGAGIAPAASAPQAAAAAPSTYLVTCRLADENGTPVTSGVCDFAFGALGAHVAVDDTGMAARYVPAGADGTVAGSAPGHAGAHASVVASGPKTVRMTLPALPKGAPERLPPRGNATAAANASAEPEPFVNTTSYSGSVRDLLLSSDYAVLPANDPTATYAFVVAPTYQTMEITGSYPAFTYAGRLHVRLLAPNGTAVFDYSPDPVAADVALMYEELGDLPLGFIVAPAPGQYKVVLEGVGAGTFHLNVYGLSGLAPDFAFTSVLDGQQHHLNDYTGQVVIVDLMAAWCGPCNAAMPGLTKIRDDYKGKVEILSVDVTYDDSGNPDTPESDTPQDLRAFIAEHNVTWPIGPDSTDYSSSGSGLYGTGYIPTLVLVDQHGGLIYRHIGEMDQAELRGRIDAALAG